MSSLPNESLSRSVERPLHKNRKLKGKDFFDVKQNPLITFKSTKIEQTDRDDFEVDGDLRYAVIV